jgi:ribosomal protein L16/L10AE
LKRGKIVARAIIAAHLHIGRRAKRLDRLAIRVFAIAVHFLGQNKRLGRRLGEKGGNVPLIQINEFL